MIPIAVNDNCPTVYGTRCTDGTLSVISENGYLPVVTDIDTLTNGPLYEEEVWLNHDASRVIVNQQKGRSSPNTRYLFFDAKDMQSWTLPTIGIDRVHNVAYLSYVDKTIVDSFKDVASYEKNKPPRFSVYSKKPEDEEVQAYGARPVVFAIYSREKQCVEELYTNAPYLRQCGGAALGDAKPAAKKAKCDHLERLRYHAKHNPLRVAEIVHTQLLTGYASARNEEIVRVCVAIKKAMDETPALRELAADCAHVGEGIYKEIALFRRVLFQNDDFIKNVIGE